MVSIIEVLLAVTVLYLLVFQVIVPILLGTKIFPMFLREKKLRAEITDVNQKVLEKDLETQIKKTKKKEGIE